MAHSDDSPAPERRAAVHALRARLGRTEVLSPAGFRRLARREALELESAWPEIRHKISSLELDHLTSETLESHFFAFCASAAHRRASFSRLFLLASGVAGLLAGALSVGVLALTLRDGTAHAALAYLLTALALTMPAAHALRNRRPWWVVVVLGVSVAVLLTASWPTDGYGWAFPFVVPPPRSPEGQVSLGIALGAALVIAVTVLALASSAVMAVVSRIHRGIRPPDVKAFDDLHAVIVGLLRRETWPRGPAPRLKVAARLEEAARSVENMHRPYAGNRRLRQQHEELRRRVAEAAWVLREGRPLHGAQDSDDRIIGACITSMIAICLGDHGKLPSPPSNTPAETRARRPARPWTFVRRLCAAVVPVATILVAQRIGVPLAPSLLPLLGVVCVTIAVVGLFRAVHPEPGRVLHDVGHLIGVVQSAPSRGAGDPSAPPGQPGPEGSCQTPSNNRTEPEENR